MQFKNNLKLRAIYLVDMKTFVMALDEGTIIQVDATVIAGVLILLTVSSLSPENLHKGPPQFLDALGGIYSATSIVILPFALSAILAIITKFWLDSLHYANRIKPLLQNKINDLNKKIESENNIKIKNNLEKELKKIERRLDKIKKKDPKFDELREETDRWNGQLASLVCMTLGFMYLIFIMFAIAQSGAPIRT